MHPVDGLHRLFRHSCADHKRETIAFGRRLESIMGRAFGCRDGDLCEALDAGIPDAHA